MIACTLLQVLLEMFVCCNVDVHLLASPRCVNRRLRSMIGLRCCFFSETNPAGEIEKGGALRFFFNTLPARRHLPRIECQKLEFFFKPVFWFYGPQSIAVGRRMFLWFSSCSSCFQVLLFHIVGFTVVALRSEHESIFYVWQNISVVGTILLDGLDREHKCKTK